MSIPFTFARLGMPIPQCSAGLMPAPNYCAVHRAFCIPYGEGCEPVHHFLTVEEAVRYARNFLGPRTIYVGVYAHDECFTSCQPQMIAVVSEQAAAIAL